MYARVTQLEIDTLRIDTDSAVEAYLSGVLPELREQPGYAGVLVLANPEGTGTIVTFWETEDEAGGSGSGFYDEVISRFTTIYKSPPGRGHYEVRFVEIPTAGLSAPGP